ncbi:unnamed protein product, partial [Meganyctiphanes norvegica]
MSPPRLGFKRNLVYRPPNQHSFLKEHALGKLTLYSKYHQNHSRGGDIFSFFWFISQRTTHISFHIFNKKTFTQKPTPPPFFLYFEVKFLQLLLGLGADNGHDVNNEDDEDEDQTAMTELHFVPGDLGLNVLETMYKALNHCQLKHPDPEDEVNEDDLYEEEEGEYEVDEDAEYEPYEENMEGELENIQRGVSGLSTQNDAEDTEEGMETGQFDDADK